MKRGAADPIAICAAFFIGKPHRLQAQRKVPGRKRLPICKKKLCPASEYKEYVGCPADGMPGTTSISGLSAPSRLYAFPRAPTVDSPSVGRRVPRFLVYA
jgi:hypothetical protein